jgi:Fe-S-cluster containining protein
MLRRFAGDRPKRDHHGAHTPCAKLKTSVVCNDLCCRHFLVTLAQEDLDDGLLTQSPFIDVLRRHERGHCHYFDERSSMCNAHEQRPLACRFYDCRDDARATALAATVNEEQAFVSQAERTCGACSKPLQLVLGCSGECDGHAVCIACGAGYRVRFLYAQRELSVTLNTNVDGRTRTLYLLRSLLYREQFAEALPLAEALGLTLERAVALAELGRRREARELLEPLGTTEAELELVWLDRLEGALDAAQERLERVLPRLSPHQRVRALKQQGRVAKERGDVEAAAAGAVAALRASRALGQRNELLKEDVRDLLNGEAPARAAVERAARGRSGQ